MIHRKKLTPSQFLSKMFAQRKAMELARNTITKLEDDYVKQNCKIKAGHVFDIPDTVKPGYNKFMVERIGTEIKEVVKTSPQEYRIGFTYFGLFTSADKEAVKGQLVFKEPVVQNIDSELIKT